MWHLAMVANIRCKLAVYWNLSATMDEQFFQYGFCFICLSLPQYCSWKLNWIETMSQKMLSKGEQLIWYVDAQLQLYLH